MPVTPSEALWLQADHLASLWGLGLQAWLRMARRKAWPLQRIAGVWCLSKPWAAKRLGQTLQVLQGLREGSWYLTDDPHVLAWASRARADMPKHHPLVACVHKIEGTRRIAIKTSARDAVEARAHFKSRMALA